MDTDQRHAATTPCANFCFFLQDSNVGAFSAFNAFDYIAFRDVLVFVRWKEYPREGDKLT